MFQFPWPKGTVHSYELPADFLDALNEFYVSSEGYVSDELPIHHTATEGPYIGFAGYKVRVTIEETSPTTYLVRLA